MNKKSILVLSTVFIIRAAGVPAQAAAPAAPTPTWTVTPALVSNYMFRGTRLGGPSFQPTVELGYGDLTAGFWGSFPMDNTVQGVSDPELNLYGSYTLALSDAASLAVGATWYHFPRAEESAGFYENTFEPNIAFSYTMAGFRFTPKIYYDIVLEGFTGEVAAIYALPLAGWGTELDFTATIGSFLWKEAAENSPGTKNWGDYWSLGVLMPFQFSAHSKVTVGFAYAKGSGNYIKVGTQPRVVNPSAVGRGVASIAYSFSF